VIMIDYHLIQVPLNTPQELMYIFLQFNLVVSE
jgi:hypothetical protein